MSGGGGGGSSVKQGNYIPEIEIIADILSNLPAISLLRFKAACKTWYSLISDPKFINLQSKRASPNPKIIVSTGPQLNLLDYESPSFNHQSLSVPLNFPADGSRFNFLKIVGSSHGLICVATADNENFQIWNPVTKEIRKIRKFGPRIKDYLHGLGYDSVSNDFKLVIWVYRFAYVLSLKTINSWKEIHCPLEYTVTINSALPWTKPPSTLATVSNGLLHWLVTPNSNVRGIIAFDLAKDGFEKLQMPTFGSRSGSVASLLELRGCLCLSFSDFGSNVREIWMMKEYGDPSSWIHLFSIDQSLQLGNFWRLPVLCVSLRNEAVLYTDNSFLRSRKEEDKFDEISIHPSVVFGAALYVDTFISPNDFNVLEQRH